MAVDLPDFAKNIGRIFRGETYLQFEPRENEKVKIFLLSHSVGAELGVGETVRLMDFETFLSMPYTSPAGWLADFREYMFTYDGLVRLDVMCDDFPGVVFSSHPPSRDFIHTYEQIIFFNSLFWDPFASNAHVWDFTLTNEDYVALTGAVQVAMVLTSMGTEVPVTKRVKCRSCGHVNTVLLKETKIKCEECGAVFFVPFFPGKVI